MKRIGNLYQKICSVDNLYLADKIAGKGKSDQPGVIEHRKNADHNILLLHEMLVKKVYKTSNYTTFTIKEPKERLIFRLPYFPDRIVHHACMIVLEPLFVSMFTRDTYSCIKGRGIHSALKGIIKALGDQQNTQYCLKLDAKKFYPSINHEVLKSLLRRKIKDPDLLTLLDEIIASAEGLPIGNYLSQYFANLYMTGFDHWIKEVKHVRYYFRYCDDMVILSSDKGHLRVLLADIRQYFDEKLKLTIKHNFQIFPVAARGIDFVGYKTFHTHILLRKSIKKNLARMIANKPNSKSIASYYGWLIHCNGRHLLKKLINEKFSRFGDKAYLQEFCRKEHFDR